MKRITKNIIMISLIALLVLISFLTMKDLRNPENPEMMPNPNIENKDTIDKTSTDSKETTTETNTDTDKSMIVKQPRMERNDMHQRGMMPKKDRRHNNRNLYVFVGLGIAALVMYLIMSGFNSKTMKETFTGIDNIIIFIISTIVITAALSAIQSVLVKDKKPMSNFTNPSTIKNTD